MYPLSFLCDFIHFLTSFVTIQCNTIESKFRLFKYAYMYLVTFLLHIYGLFPLIRKKEVNFVIED